MRAGQGKGPGAPAEAPNQKKQPAQIKPSAAPVQAKSANWHPLALKYGRGRILTDGFVDFLEQQGRLDQ